MAILKVAQMGHPVLRQIAAPVSEEERTSKDFLAFCQDLYETMVEYNGVGIAAPQVHVPKRVVLAQLSDERGPEYLINPEIEVLDGPTMHTWEGCLSVEGIRGRVERPAHIRLRALGVDGGEKDYELEGFPAIVAQHECDHLDGVLYIDRADPLSLAFLREYEQFGPLVGEDEEEDEDGELMDEGVDV
jgi:peptide deformylase